MLRRPSEGGASCTSRYQAASPSDANAFCSDYALLPKTLLRISSPDQLISFCVCHPL